MVQRVTGWQGNDGGQGGWNQPPYGNDPYNSDPYGQQAGPQGTAPYPFGPAGGQNPYQTGGFPAQSDPYAPDQYGQYNPYQTGGFPSPGFGPPPPPKRSRLPMILGVLAIVIIVGAVVAIVLVNRQDSGGTASPQETSEKKPAPRSQESPPSSESSGPADPGGQDGWKTVDNTSDAGLTYQVPPDWEISPQPRPSGLDVDFTGSAEYGVYSCQDASYVRSFVASGDVQSREGADLDLARTVSDFAKSFGTGYFKDTAKVDVGKPEETEVGGKQAVKLTAPVTPQVTVPECEAAKGEIAIIGVLLEDGGTPAGVAMLVVVSDVEGGPDDPAPLPTDVAQDILDSARVG